MDLHGLQWPLQATASAMAFAETKHTSPKAFRSGYMSSSVAHTSRKSATVQKSVCQIAPHPATSGLLDVCSFQQLHPLRDLMPVRAPCAMRLSFMLSDGAACRALAALAIS